MEKTIIALPNGEWWDSLEEALRKADVFLTRASRRSYLIGMPELGITGIMTRTKDVPKIVDDPRSKAVAGITGTDILVNSGRRKLSATETDPVLPLSELVPTAPRPKVYLATTPNLPRSFDLPPEVVDVLEGVHRDRISRNTAAVVRI